VITKHLQEEVLVSVNDLVEIATDRSERISRRTIRLYDVVIGIFIITLLAVGILFELPETIRKTVLFIATANEVQLADSEGALLTVIEIRRILFTKPITLIHKCWKNVKAKV